MKVYINASTDIEAIRKKLDAGLYQYIKELRIQYNKDYYKHIRKQFTVNGKKYIVKNDYYYNLHIINPEGEELYKFYALEYVFQYTLDAMVDSIIDDAYPENA